MMTDGRDELERKRAELESKLAKLLADGDHDATATLAIGSYGPEIFSFLVAIHGNEADADEVFAIFSEAFWKALATFERNSTFRTFAYAIARRLSLKHRRNTARNKKRFHAMESSIVSRLVHEVRSKTGRVELTETRSRLLALRASLPPEDQELLMLRLDRRLRWEELAQVLHAEDEVPLAPEKLKKETVRLRKRFQLIKDRLREMARRDGLLGDDD